MSPDLPKPTTDLAHAKQDVDAWGYCMLKDALDPAGLRDSRRQPRPPRRRRYLGAREDHRAGGGLQRYGGYENGAEWNKRGVYALGELVPEEGTDDG